MDEALNALYDAEQVKAALLIISFLYDLADIDLPLDIFEANIMIQSEFILSFVLDLEDYITKN